MPVIATALTCFLLAQHMPRGYFLVARDLKWIVCLICVGRVIVVDVTREGRHGTNTIHCSRKVLRSDEGGLIGLGSEKLGILEQIGLTAL